MSELVIGLTVVAIGTSLPELAATAGAALKATRTSPWAMCWVNILNLLAVMAVPGLFGAFPLEPAVLTRDGLAMAGLSLLLVLAARFGGGRLGRLAWGLPRAVDCLYWRACLASVSHESTASLFSRIARAQPITLLCLDVDGVLTDGHLIYAGGQEAKAFNSRTAPLSSWRSAKALSWPSSPGASPPW